MQLLNAKQIKQWDQFTIDNEPVSSIDLMERASMACAGWIKQYFNQKPLHIFCGPGNNGGDGLAIARLLKKDGFDVHVFIVNTTRNFSTDFLINLQRLKAINNITINYIDTLSDIPSIPNGSVTIDALFGTGLNREVDSLYKELIIAINNTINPVIAIDISSGLLCDGSSKEFVAIRATHTLTFECLKLAFLLPENEPYFGQVHVLNIGLKKDFLASISSVLNITDNETIRAIYKPRSSFSHKGNYGHALLLAGSFGKMGAAVLSTKGCLRSGAGLVTAHVPEKGIDIIQTNVPEAMCFADYSEKHLSTIDYELKNYSAIGIGPGIGQHAETTALLLHLISSYKKPLVIDADALNIIAQNKNWLSLIPKGSILTPHPKEFDRLFNKSKNDFEKINTALSKAKEFGIIIVLKGHRSLIALPSGKGYFNTSGNAGMATGGSGDVLTGIITGLLAQGYMPEQAAILGVYLHGLAGDKAAEKYGMDAMIAGDIIEGLTQIRLGLTALILKGQIAQF